jgi:hypothetical protein
MMAHDWARPDAVARHYELFAQHDAEVPGLGRSHAGRRALRPQSLGRSQRQQADALAAWTDKHAKERADKS